MRAEFRSLLLTSTGISTAVGTRVFPTKLPQDPTYPAVTYQVISGDTEESLNGPSRLKHARMQVDSWGASYSDAVSLAGQVRTLLDEQRAIQDGIGFVSKLSNDTDRYEDSIGVWRILQDFDLTWWSES